MSTCFKVLTLILGGKSLTFYLPVHYPVWWQSHLPQACEINKASIVHTFTYKKNWVKERTLSRSCQAMKQGLVLSSSGFQAIALSVRPDDFIITRIFYKWEVTKARTYCALHGLKDQVKQWKAQHHLKIIPLWVFFWKQIKDFRFCIQRWNPVKF